MSESRAATSSEGGGLAGAWRRGAEWLWRSEAMRRARAGARPMDAAARGHAARARSLAALAERHLAEREPWTHGAGDAAADAAEVARTLYRDARDEARRALGEAPAGGDAAEVALDALRAEVDGLLAAIARAEGDVEPLWAERFARVGSVLVAAAALAAAPRAAWYATHYDRAPDAHWIASSAAVGYESSGRGFAPPDFKIPVFFHTNVEDSPSIAFDLGRAVDLSEVTVINRADCCDDRAVPLVMEVSDDNGRWREVGRRVETFKRWTLALPTPTVARWVRLHATRRTQLHLEAVVIR